MRIISGNLRSRRINPPANLPVRPTTDMAKEALFNIINNEYYFEGLDVLDLFAGTGSISFEFCSREANSVTSVDKNPKCVKFISDTKEALNLDMLEVVQADAFKFLERNFKKYDIIFADPPYDMPDFNKLADLIIDKDILNDDGLIIIEHSKKTNFNSSPNCFQTRKYGSVNFSFFKK